MRRGSNLSNVCVFSPCLRKKVDFRLVGIEVSKSILCLFLISQHITTCVFVVNSVPVNLMTCVSCILTVVDWMKEPPRRLLAGRWITKLTTRNLHHRTIANLLP